MNLLIMGPAGSGKGTMSAKIVEDFPIPHISTGDMLRSTVASGSELGQKVKAIMDQGKLVSDEIILEMVKERISQADCKEGFLFDGFPRTLVQAKELDAMLSEMNREIDTVINLTVEFDALADRITGRRLCPNCGEIYHITGKPSKVEGICDVCGHNLIQRSDDTVEQLKVRLAEHDNLTAPVLDYYGDKGVVRNVNASQDVDKVYNDVKQELTK